MTRIISAEVIITLPTGEVICRQVKREVEAPDGWCLKLVAASAKRLLEKELRQGIKVEVV